MSCFHRRRHNSKLAAAAESHARPEALMSTNQCILGASTDGLSPSLSRVVAMWARKRARRPFERRGEAEKRVVAPTDSAGKKWSFEKGVGQLGARDSRNSSSSAHQCCALSLSLSLGANVARFLLIEKRCLRAEGGAQWRVPRQIAQHNLLSGAIL